MHLNALGRCLLSWSLLCSQSHGSLGDSGEQPVPTTRSALWPPRSRAVTSLQCICLHKLHWQEVKLRRSMCNGWKAPSAPCGLGWVPQILPQQQDTPQDTSSPQDQLPPAHPRFPQWPRARSPAGRWRRTWLRLFHTLSPSLWWWLVSQQSHLHRYAFSEGFFFFLVKKQWKNPKSN